jgi:chemotaxis protein MotB
MSRKKHPEHVNHERWLVSYADFITLLFAFFVVLFASEQSDKRKAMLLAHSMQQAFAHNGIFDPHSPTPAIADVSNAIPQAAPMALPLPAVTAPPELGKVNQKQEAERIQGVVHNQVEKRQMTEGNITVHESAEGLVVSLREAGFFGSGSAEVRPEELGVLRALAAALPNQPMRVEGHTDNVPIHTAQFATNWELSPARAASITRLLIGWKITEPEKVSAAGYAEFRPVADNDTEQGRMRNRRVDIVLLKEPEPVTPPAPKP